MKLFCTTRSCREYGSKSIREGSRRKISLNNAPRHRKHGRTCRLSDVKTGKENDSREKMCAVTRGQQSTRNKEKPMLRSGPRRRPQ